MNTDDEQLDQMLESVQLKAASPDLADRIIAASRQQTVQQENQQEEESLIRLILDSLLVFKPAPMMASFLLVGILSGWYIQAEPDQTHLAVEDELVEFIDYELSML